MTWEMDFGERAWHQWFAWYPVRLHGTNTKVWWEWVERETINAQGYLVHHHRKATEAA